MAVLICAERPKCCEIVKRRAALKRSRARRQKKSRNCGSGIINAAKRASWQRRRGRRRPRELSAAHAACAAENRETGAAVEGGRERPCARAKSMSSGEASEGGSWPSWATAGRGPAASAAGAARWPNRLLRASRPAFASIEITKSAERRKPASKIS